MLILSYVYAALCFGSTIALIIVYHLTHLLKARVPFSRLQSFERVVVQNITHGLSPGLCEAMESVSRWKIVQAALPHVIHCCASVLNERKASNPDSKFGSNETKLLYTLHWIIQDAASECEDFDIEQNIQRGVQAYLHPLETVQVYYTVK